MSTYPILLEKIDLVSIIENLKKLTPTIGCSGHYFGINDTTSAICNGSRDVEQYFTVDQNLPGCDNKFTILPEEV